MLKGGVPLTPLVVIDTTPPDAAPFSSNNSQFFDLNTAAPALDDRST